MATEILEIQPPELKFLFELKKQSSCSIQLSNKSDQYVAFKVKTTSPRKYCVRPNIGIIKPQATRSFTVTMQAQHMAPPNMQCKDKFLIQNSCVPFGTTEEDITTEMFAKYSCKYIEEKKMKVVLVSAPQFPVLLPISGEMKQDLYNDLSNQKGLLGGLENMNMPRIEPQGIGEFETVEDIYELKVVKDIKVVEDLESLLANNEQELEPVEVMGELKSLNGFEELKPATNVEDLNSVKGVEELKSAKDVDELKSVMDVADLKLAKDVDGKPKEDVEVLKAESDMEKMRLAKAFEELKLKHDEVAIQLSEAKLTIMKLTKEISLKTRESDRLTSELKILRRNSRREGPVVGFPLRFVCMIALISLAVGYNILP